MTHFYIYANVNKQTKKVLSTCHLVFRHIRRQAHGLSGPFGKRPGPIESGVGAASRLEPERNPVFFHQPRQPEPRRELEKPDEERGALQ